MKKLTLLVYCLISTLFAQEVSKKESFIQYFPLAEAQNTFCDAIDFALVKMNPPPMGAFVANKISPWVQEQAEEFPSNALFHPVLGEDLATYLPTPRSFLELRTFYLSKAKNQESSALCDLYKNFLSRLYEIQSYGFEISKSSDPNSKEENFEYLFKDDKINLIIPKPINKSTPRHSVVSIYKDLNLFVPQSLTDGANTSTPSAHSNWINFASRNFEWKTSLDFFESFKEAMSHPYSYNQNERNFLKADLWPFHSRQGSNYTDVKSRGDVAWESFSSNLKSIERTLESYWFELLDSKTNFAETLNRKDRRAQRLESFNNLLVAELIYFHKTKTPQRIVSLQKKWSELFLKRKEIEDKFNSLNEKQKIEFAQKRLEEISEIKKKQIIYTQVKKQLQELMKTKNYSAVKTQAVLKKFTKNRNEYTKVFLESAVIVQSNSKPIVTPAQKPQETPANIATDRNKTKDISPLPQRTHTIQKGDHLISIALKYKVDLGELMNANGIKNQQAIKVGQTLIIPSENN